MKNTRKQDETIKVGWTVASMCAIVAVAVLFTFFPGKVGTYRSATDPATFTPLLSPGFALYLPWLYLWWGPAFMLHLAHLILGHRTVVTRWIDLVVHLYGAYLLGWMALSASSIVQPSAAAEIQGLLALGCAGILLGVAKQLRRLLAWKPIIIQWEQG